MGEQIRQQFVSTYQGMVDSIIAWTPTILLAVLLLISALVVAKVIERILRTVMVRLRFDALVEKVGIDQAIQRLGMRESLNVVIPRIVYYLLLFLFARTAADSLGLSAISNAIGSFMAYLPNIIAALLILILGSAAAQFAGRAVSEAAGNSGIEFASTLGQAVRATFFLMVPTAAIFIVLSTDIVRLLFERGSFPVEAANTGIALPEFDVRDRRKRHLLPVRRTNHHVLEIGDRLSLFLRISNHDL